MLCNAIMDGKSQLIIQEFYTSINKITIYECNESNYSGKMEILTQEIVESDIEFDISADKVYINIILSQTSDKWTKFELLNVFYKNIDRYKDYAKQSMDEK